MKCDSSTKLPAAKNTTSSSHCPEKTASDSDQGVDGTEVSQGISNENTKLDIASISQTQTKLLEANVSQNTEIDNLESLDPGKAQTSCDTQTSDKCLVTDKSVSNDKDEYKSNADSGTENTSASERKDNESQRNFVPKKEFVTDENTKEPMEICQGERLTDDSHIDPNISPDIDIGKKLGTNSIETEVCQSHSNSEENMIVDAAQEPSRGSFHQLECGSKLENEIGFHSEQSDVNVVEHDSALPKGIEAHDFVDGNMCSKEVSTVSDNIWFECKEIILEMVQYVSDEMENLKTVERANDGNELDGDDDSSSDEDGLFLHREDIGKSTHEENIDQSSRASSDNNLTDSLNDSKLSGDSLHEAESENPLSIDKAGKILTLWNQITEGSNTTNEELIELIAQKLEEEKSKLSQDTNIELSDSFQDDYAVANVNNDVIAKSNETIIDSHSKQESQTFPGKDFDNKPDEESFTAKTDDIEFKSSVKLQKSLVNEPSNKTLSAQNKSNGDLPVKNSAQNTDPSGDPNSTRNEKKKEGVTSDITLTDLSEGSLNKEDTTMVPSINQVVVESEKVQLGSKTLSTQNKSNGDLPVKNSAQNTDSNSEPNSTTNEKKKEGVTCDITLTDLSEGSINKEDTTMVPSIKQVVVEPEKVQLSSKSASTLSLESRADSKPLSSNTKKDCVDVDEANKTNVDKGNKAQNELENKREKPVIIDLESQSDTNNHAKDNTLVRRGEVTPVKQIRQGIMQTPTKTPARHPLQMRSPRQIPFGSGASPSARQTPLKGNNTPGKSPVSTPSKKNFIENLIATGIPIIIPDDDDTMPQERSQEFKMKSRQYQQESLKARSQYRGNNERSPDRLIENANNNNLASMFTPPRPKTVERLNTIFPVPPSSDFRSTTSKPFSLTPPARNTSRGPLQLHTRPVAPSRQVLAYPEAPKHGYSLSHGFSPGRPNTGIAMQGQGQSQLRPIASQSQFIRHSPQMSPQRHIPPKSTHHPPAGRGNISGTLVIIDDDTPSPKVTKPKSLGPNIKRSPVLQVQHTQQHQLSTEMREPFKQVQATQQRKQSSEVQESPQFQATQPGKLLTEAPDPLLHVQVAQQRKATKETQQPYMQAHITQQKKLVTDALEAGKVQATQKKMSTEIQDSPMPIITNVQSMAPAQNKSNDADKLKKQSALPNTPSEKSAITSESLDKITIKQEPPDQYEQTAPVATKQNTSQDSISAKRDRPIETDKDKIQTTTEPLSKRIKIEPGTEEETISNTKDPSKPSETCTRDHPTSNTKDLSQLSESSSSNTMEKVPPTPEKALVITRDKLSEKPETLEDVPLRQTRKSSRDKAEKQAPAKDKRDEDTFGSPSKSRPEVVLDVDVDDAESYHSNLSLEQVLQQMPSVSDSASATAGIQKIDSDTSSLKVHSHRNSSKNEKDSGTDSEITSSEDVEKGKGDRLAKGDKSQKQFGCGDCGKTYSSKQSLAQHFKVHTREQPFECDVCGKHFSMKTSLKKHIYTHFKEKE